MIKEKNIQSSEKEKDGFEKSKLASIPEDWEIETLGNLGEFLKGKGVAKKEILDNGIPCVRYGEIYTIHHEYIKEFHSFINKTSAEDSFKLEKGDLLFAGSGEKLEDIGKCVAYLNDFNAYAGGDIVVLRNHQQNPAFMGFLLNTPIFRRQAHKLGQGHSVVHIYSSGLKNVKIPLPPLPEQQKIATILSKWDNAIDKLTQLIAAKELQKKGLMQQLLTGELRFPGFEDEWVEVKMSDISKLSQGLQIAISERFTESKPGRHFYITNEFLKSDSTYVYYIQNPPKSVLCDESDILMTRTGNTGKVVTGVSGAFHNNFFRVSYDRSRIEKNFLFYALNSDRIQYNIGRLAGTSTIPDINHSDFYSITIKLPNVVEQGKISCLIKKADQEIEILKKELASFQEQKNGLMQVLLTGEVRV